MLAARMALLKHRATGDLHSLASRHIVGRAPGSHLHLRNRLVSSTHAEFQWNGSAWELRDLGSRNGTFVGARRLESGERMTIRRGARIAFGDASDLFELVDAGPPNAVARTHDGQRQEAEDGYLSLPDPEHPVLTIFQEGGGIWVAEAEDGARTPILNGDSLRVEGRVWQVELPRISESTWQPDTAQMTLHRATMRFAVSRDEEHVEVSLIQDNQVVSLPPRVHDYLLLTLARARLEEQRDPEISEAEAGWLHVSDLADMLRTSETTLNVSICRARRELVRAEVFGAAEIIERRPSSRHIRLGVQSLEILTI